MNTISREFHIFAKPVSAACNLNCSYCYYSGENNKIGLAINPRMEYDLLEKYIVQHIEATTDDLIFFSWHGGEPTLAGVDFYRKAVELQKKHLPKGKKLLNGIQTNGTLINEEWCRFLKKESFLVGISMDGPEEFHKRFRIKNNGFGTYNEVLRGYRLLQRHEITTEILCVVNASNAEYPLEVYRFFKSLNAGFITFLPLVEQKSGFKPEVTENTVSPETFGKFLINIFDDWVENDIGKVTIQIFEEALRAAIDNEHTLCIFKVNCGGVPVIEGNGDFYSCDHFVKPEHLLGSIKYRPVSDFLDSDEQKAFGRAKSITLPKYCKNCHVLSMCNGECPKNRFIETPDGEQGLNYLCAGYKMFFKHCLPFIEAVRTAVAEGC
ncbi:MAG: hypothetical protein FD181_3357 [Prolixibacteraceae bacterium]|nr:MAG: hypothetical protein FD181_3357 [Prolixibacteraceae bacterium]